MKQRRCGLVAVIVCILFLMGINAGADLMDNLISWWKFDDSSGSITDAMDNYSGTYNGALYQQAGVSNYSLGFDGNDDCVSTATIDIGTSHTLTAWIYADDLSYYSAVLGYTGDSYMSPLLLCNSSGNTVFYYHDGSVYKYLNLGEDISGSWRHVAIVRNGTTVDVYLDGVNKGSFNLDYNTGMYVDVVGARQGSSGLDFFFEGEIDELRIYDQPLGTGDIQNIFTGQLCCWQFEESNGSFADVISGNTATYNGNLYQRFGVAGYGLGFDGVNDYLSFSEVEIGTTHTVAAWVNLDDLSYYKTVLGYTGDSFMTPMMFINSSGNTFFYYHDGSTYKSLNLGENIAGSWRHVAISRDGTDVDFYLDGAKKGSLCLDYNTPIYVDVAGARQGASGLDFFFDGAIDELKIYDRALDATVFQGLQSGLFAGWKFDESSGAILDVAQYNNGSYNGSLYQQTGKSGYALGFDGVNDRITIPVIDIGTHHTVAVWIYADDLSYYSAVLGYTGDSYMSPLLLMNDDGTTWLYYHDGTTFKQFDLDEDITGKWQHLAVVRNETNIDLYLNGEKKGSIVLSTNPDLLVDVIGARQGSSGLDFFFDGAFDELNIYNRALSSREVLDLMCLCGRWEMNEGQGTTTADSSGSGNNASFVNMAGSPWADGHLNPDGFFRKSLRFNNSGDYLQVANVSSLQITGDLTVSLWIKPTTVGIKQCSLIDKDFGGEFSLVLEQDGSVSLLQGKSQSSGEYFSATVIPSGSIENGNWQHVAVTRNMTTRDIKGYLDGELQNTVTYPDNSSYSPPAATSSVVKIGSGYFSDYNGDIDKVRLYNVVLSEKQLKMMQLLSAYANKTYYTSENGTAVCTLDIPVSVGLSSCYLVAKDSQGNTLGTNSSPGNTTDLTFDISSLSTGSNTVTIELHRTAGERITACEMNIMKRASNTGFETKVDLKNGIVYRDGTAFFPVGFYMYNISSSGTTHFQTVASEGFSDIIRWNTGAVPADATTYLETAASYDLNVLDSHDAYSTVYLGSYKLGTSQDFWDAYKGLGDAPINVDQSARMVQAVSYAKEESNLIGYYNFDEPYASQIEAGQDLYARTNTEDGYHPSFILFTHTIPEGDDFTDWCDIIGVDPYWKPPEVADTPASSLDWVTRSVYLAKKRAKQDHKALWVTLMAEFYSGCLKRAITVDEQRCQTYLALIHGAKGIYYFKYPVFHEDLWNGLLDLKEELDTLTPSVLTPDLDQTITYSSGLFDPDKDQYPDVQVSLFKAPAGADFDYVLLAVNTRNYAVNTTFSISLLGSSGTVSRLFSASNYSISNGSFSEQLPELATRAYTFDSTSTSQILVNVAMSPQTAPTAETVYPITGRTGKTNIMQNPSLEDNTIANWPDYCWPYTVPATGRINSQNQSWGLETSDPYHGSKCLRISKDTISNGVRFYLVPEHDNQNGEDYTFSAYMKADQAGRQVTMGCSLGSTTVTLTTSWARYSYTCNVPIDVYEYNQFYIELENNNSTVWIDAVQVEEGSNATTFTTN
jgi:hypothetical protein